MNRRQNDLQRSIDEFLADVSDPDADLVLDGVMAACALMAYADGAVAREERMRMLSIVPRFASLRFFSQAELIDAFERAAARFEDAQEDGALSALQTIRRVREHPRYARPLLRACHAIATADRTFDSRERQALVSICVALDLDPGEYGLREPG
jgi:tellurite resistance protein TerB